MEMNSQKDGLLSQVQGISLDLTTYKVQLHFSHRKEPLVVFFDTQARRFYFSVIALIVHEMKKKGRIDFLSIRKYEKILKLLDGFLAGKNASRTVKSMWDKVRKAWRYTLPDLATAALFKVLDKSRISPVEKGGKYRYVCSEEECDVWANLFDYDESNPWKLKFAIDSVGVGLDDVTLAFGKLSDDDAWQEFIKNVNPLPKEVDVKTEAAAKLWQKPALFIALVFIVGVLITAGWQLYMLRTSQETETEFSSKPSIAVLPFTNMSGDPGQEYFSDGMSDDLITDLSKIPDLFVIARNSTFAYKGKQVKVQQIAKELGVRYILEGSVRREEELVRINAQLIDATSGHHLWAGRFDRKVKDVFTLQDLISKEILTALKVELTMGEQVRLFANNTDNIEAYLLFLQAVDQQRKSNQEGNIRARKLCEEAIALDGKFADPYRLLAYTYLFDIWFGWTDSPRKAFKKAEELANISFALDEKNPNTLAMMGHLSLLKRQHDKAISLGEESIRLGPNNANNYMILANSLRFSGRAAEGIPLLKKAIQLEPYTSANIYYNLGMAYNFTGQYKDAIAVLKKGLERTPDHLLSFVGLTVAYSLSGRLEEARATAAEIMLLNPSFSVAKLEKSAPYKHKADLDLSMGAMRRAGLM